MAVYDSEQLDTTMKQSFLIKANVGFTCLLRDVSIFAKGIAVEHDLQFAWLQFAERTLYGYRFLRNKKLYQHDLANIVEKATNKHPSYSSSYISEVLSQLVNISVEDAIRLQNISFGDRVLSAKERQFLLTPLIAISDSIHYLPRHPWFMPEENAKGDLWKAKDIVTQTSVLVNKKKKGDFYEYEIEQAPSQIL